MLHLLVPIRHLISYATLKGVDRIPVCFFCDKVDGRVCPYKNHNSDDLEVAVSRRIKNIKDLHIWRTPEDLMRISGLTKILDDSAPDISHSITTRKMSNLHQILDITSSTKQAITSQSWRDKGLGLIDVIFFVLCCTVFIDEGHYVITFLWAYERLHTKQLIADADDAALEQLNNFC